METKICNTCGIEKELSEYRLRKDNNKYMNTCKKCYAKKAKIWENDNKELINLIRKKHRENNKEYYKEKNKINKEKIILWMKNNPEKVKGYRKKQQQTIKGKMESTLRSRLNIILKKQGACKTITTFKLLGCSPTELILYLEQQFVTDGIRITTWDNYGKEWHIDHIKPCSLFNLLLESEQQLCFHYTNLQVLWKEDNLSKHNNINWQKDPNKYQPIGKVRGNQFEDMFE